MAEHAHITTAPRRTKALKTDARISDQLMAAVDTMTTIELALGTLHRASHDPEIESVRMVAIGGIRKLNKAKRWLDARREASRSQEIANV
jgi:hypothetical protein